MLILEKLQVFFAGIMDHRHRQRPFPDGSKPLHPVAGCGCSPSGLNALRGGTLFPVLPGLLRFQADQDRHFLRIRLLAVPDHHTEIKKSRQLSDRSSWPNRAITVRMAATLGYRSLLPEHGFTGKNQKPRRPPPAGTCSHMPVHKNKNPCALKGLHFIWCAWRDLNPHGFPPDPKSGASANSATRAERNGNNVAGDLGFEPRNDGVKVRCLTAWLIPSVLPLHGGG